MKRRDYIKFTEGIYRATRGLIQLTPEEKFTYKPKEGLLTIAQVIKHLSSALGASLVMGVKEEWPPMSDEEMLPPAEKFPSAVSVATALEEIDADWRVLLEEIEKITDGEFAKNQIRVPWMPAPMTLQEYMLQSAEHLSNHRMQLFIWLKLSGEPLHTGHLYGMS
jgi:hypothetical protein